MDGISIFENEFLYVIIQIKLVLIFLKLFNKLEWFSPWNIIDQLKTTNKISESNILLTLENIFSEKKNPIQK